ncbi:prepilin-type N-terminal cleavage/methylation domain-containing protein [Deinococcus psychrotolerans]|uniref:Prepilin-type N-terminal cleavage/methylation domain-containing protein n=1 Tax=Deinococcus psychrotolerans TaxID=2489213 RepID=A0A3G8YNW0_9DEIO|nr:prepilin-type N-terminal cleavage/methylation domain-containing protein [Deinococcus psychrotolerans]AZI44304.1 prepilin-type N-terminal cleavage/methylation domain-containing protein [Deinococcus psychrotolerans]
MPKSLAPPLTAGFTIVELLVVIFIIGLILSLTLPNLHNDNRDVDLFAFQLSSYLEDAQQLARTQEEKILVNYNCRKKEFSWVQFTSTDPSVTGTYEESKIVADSILKVPDKLDVAPRSQVQCGNMPAYVDSTVRTVTFNQSGHIISHTYPNAFIAGQENDYSRLTGYFVAVSPFLGVRTY